MRSLDVLETCIYVDDLQAAERFYETVLQLEVIGRQEDRHVFFRCGRGLLLVFNPQASSDPKSEVPWHGANGPGHVAFRVSDSDFAAWEIRLRSLRVPVEKTVDWPQGGRSVYFRDPAGNSIELASPRIWGLEE